jgi:PTH1 family peptidyl-tRNA hydrolase
VAYLSRQEVGRIVVGLGNPGSEFDATRHNAGFMCIDALGERLGARYWKLKGSALVALVEHEGRTLALAKPQTFMNLSGSAVRALCRAYDVSPRDIIVVHDEMDLQPGDVRVKRGGNHAGHNGVRSIYEQLDSKDVIRVRIGIGRPPGRMDGADYVLQHLKDDLLEEQRVDCEVAADAVLCVLDDGLDAAMQLFNGRHRCEE